MRKLLLPVVIASWGLTYTMRAEADPLGREWGRAEVRFARASVALPAAEREVLLREVAQLLNKQPCRMEFFYVAAYGDRGLEFSEMRGLALERAKYISSLVSHVKGTFSEPSMYVGGDRAEEAGKLGTGEVHIQAYVGKLACGS